MNENNNPNRLIHVVEYYLHNAALSLEYNGLHNLAIACNNVILYFRHPDFEKLYQQFLNDVRNISDEDKENVKLVIIQMKNIHNCIFMNDYLDIFEVEH